MSRRSPMPGSSRQPRDDEEEDRPPRPSNPAPPGDWSDDQTSEPSSSSYQPSRSGRRRGDTPEPFINTERMSLRPAQSRSYTTRPARRAYADGVVRAPSRSQGRQASTSAASSSRAARRPYQAQPMNLTSGRSASIADLHPDFFDYNDDHIAEDEQATTSAEANRRAMMRRLARQPPAFMSSGRSAPRPAQRSPQGFGLEDYDLTDKPTDPRPPTNVIRRGKQNNEPSYGSGLPSFIGRSGKTKTHKWSRGSKQSPSPARRSSPDARRRRRYPMMTFDEFRSFDPAAPTSSKKYDKQVAQWNDFLKEYPEALNPGWGGPREPRVMAPAPGMNDSFEEDDSNSEFDSESQSQSGSTSSQPQSRSRSGSTKPAYACDAHNRSARDAQPVHSIGRFSRSNDEEPPKLSPARETPVEVDNSDADDNVPMFQVPEANPQREKRIPKRVQKYSPDEVRRTPVKRGRGGAKGSTRSGVEEPPPVLQRCDADDNASMYEEPEASKPRNLKRQREPRRGEKVPKKKIARGNVGSCKDPPSFNTISDDDEDDSAPRQSLRAGR